MLRAAGNTTGLAYYLDQLAGYPSSRAKQYGSAVYYWRDRNREIDFIARPVGWRLGD